VSLPIGSTVDEYNPSVIDPFMAAGADGTGGAKNNSTTSGDTTSAETALLANELAGKIGPSIEPYDPEGKNRLIQEF
jgi:hypothetical protein